jgi:hypothetical protein
VPATSAAVERFFSAFVTTISDLRTRLSSKTAEQLLFLKLNWDDSFYNVRLAKRVSAPAGEGGEQEDVVFLDRDELHRMKSRTWWKWKRMGIGT